MAIAAIGAASVLTFASDLGAKSAGLLSVRETFDDSKGTPVEGYVSYLVVRRAGSGDVVIKESKAGLVRSTSVLTRGAYRLRTYIRTCSGNCNFLDPPTNSCSAQFRIKGSPGGATEIVKAKIRRDGNGCRVVIDGSS